MKKMKKNNKGFSLVELIIVIAIMAVLVGVLAPQFIKYVEQSRRGTDIQNAEQIRTAILADMADGVITGTGNLVEFTGTTPPTTPLGSGATTISSAPTVQGTMTGFHGNNFLVTYNAGTGVCNVSVSNGTVTYILTDPTSAGHYKTDTAPTAH